MARMRPDYVLADSERPQTARTRDEDGVGAFALAARPAQRRDVFADAGTICTVIRGSDPVAGAYDRVAAFMECYEAGRLARGKDAATSA